VYTSLKIQPTQLLFVVTQMSKQITISKQVLEKMLEEIGELKKLAEKQIKICQT
jgi:hypothetical protein